MKRNKNTNLALLAILALAGVARSQFEIARFTIDGGGAMRSTDAGGDFELSGTIGQPDAGTMIGGNFRLTGGFWFEVPPGGCDTVLDLLEHLVFVDCMAGPASGIPPACDRFDADGSETIDLADFAKRQSCVFE